MKQSSPKRLPELSELDSLFFCDAEAGQLIRKKDANYNAKRGTVAGHLHNDGYIAVQIKGDKYLVHRIIWYMHNRIEPDKQLDHIDGNRLNNKITNLRTADNSINQKNTQLRKDNKTGVPGVVWYNLTGKWRASISSLGVKEHLGYFDDFFEACCARKSAENKRGFHQNHGRTAR